MFNFSRKEDNMAGKRKAISDKEEGGDSKAPKSDDSATASPIINYSQEQVVLESGWESCRVKKATPQARRFYRAFESQCETSSGARYNGFTL